MSSPVFRSQPGRLLGLSYRGWLEAAVLLAVLAALNAVEPINKLLVRDVIQRNETDQELSELADEVVVQALLCRRFEKDILLTLSDAAAQDTYRARWSGAAADLDRAIEAFRAAAVTASDQRQAALWRSASVQYRDAVQQTLEAIDAGRITTPGAANRALEAAKVPIRSLTETAMSAAQAKETAAESSSDAIYGAFAGSARTLTILALVGCLLWVMLTRR